MVDEKVVDMAVPQIVTESEIETIIEYVTVTKEVNVPGPLRVVKEKDDGPWMAMLITSAVLLILLIIICVAYFHLKSKQKRRPLSLQEENDRIKTDLIKNDQIEMRQESIQRLDLDLLTANNPIT